MSQLNEGTKITISTLVIGIAFVMLVYGALEISAINNSSSANGLTPLATFELVVAASVLLPLGWVGLYRSTEGKQRFATQGSGLLLGGVIFGAGLYWEAVTTSSVNFLTVYGATPVIFAGLALLVLAINSFLAVSARSVAPFAGEQVEDSRSPQPTRTIPGDSAYCPYCGSAISADHRFCRKCGKPIA